MIDFSKENINNALPITAGKITEDDLRAIRAVEIFNSLFKVDYMLLFGSIRCQLNTGKVLPYYVLWNQLSKIRSQRNMDRFCKIVFSITSNKNQDVFDALKDYVSFMNFDQKIPGLLHEKYLLYKDSRKGMPDNIEILRQISDYELTVGIHKALNFCTEDKVNFTDRFGRLLELDTEIYMRLGLPPIHLISTFNGILERMFFEVGQKIHGDRYTTVSGMFHLKRSNVSEDQKISFNYQQSNIVRSILKKYVYELNSIIRIYNNAIGKIDSNCNQIVDTIYKTSDVINYNSDMTDINMKLAFNESVNYLVNAIAKISDLFRNKLTPDELMDWCLKANMSLCNSLHLRPNRCDVYADIDSSEYRVRKKDIYDDLKAHVMLATFNTKFSSDNQIGINNILKASVF